MKFNEIPIFEFLSDSRTPVVERNFYKILDELETGEEQKNFIDSIQGKGRSLFKFPTWAEYKNIDLPTQTELAEYLGVTKGAVSQYDKTKKELMLLGLSIIKEKTTNEEA